MFVLREVFGFDYDEIAGAVGKSVAIVRQVAHRAREHVQARRKRFEPADSAMTAELTEQFMSAASTGDVDGLMAMLAPDATWTADSDGKASAARRPIVGAKKVAGILTALFRVAAERMPDVRFETAVYNSSPAMVVYNGDQLEGVFLIEIIDGKITHFYAMRNPDKLLGIAVPQRDRPRASDKLSRCGSTGSATWAAPQRCCALSPRPRTGVGWHRLPR